MDLKNLQETEPWEWPGDTPKALKKALTDGRASAADRLIAAELAGDFTVINDELAAALMAILRDPNEPDELRAQAAVSFGPALEQADTFEFDDPDDVPISEEMFHEIQEALQTVYFDSATPKFVQRRVMEASVRATADWHPDAIDAAYASGDREWMLTAVFAMRYVRGFEERILEALENPDPDIHLEAVQAAGNWGVDAAWPHVVALVENPQTESTLLLAAIEAVGAIRPAEAGEILTELADSDDEEIAEAATEAMAMAEAAVEFGEDDIEDEEESEDDDWVN